MKLTIPTLILLVVAVVVMVAGGVEMKPRENSENERPRPDTLLAQADDLFGAQKYEAALEIYENAVSRAREEFDHGTEIEALAQLARVNLILGNKEESQSRLEETKDKARASDPLGWSRYLGVRGRFEWQGNDLIAARKTFEEMQEFCEANGIWDRAIDAVHMVAIVADKPEEQIEWNRRGIRMAEANDVERWLGPLWNNLAGTYYDLKQYDSALTCYLKAREYHWRFSGETGKLYADYHVGMTYRLLAQYEDAGEWLRPVLAWAERLENHSAIGQACEDLGESEIGLGNKAEGIKLLRRAREQYRKAGFDESWPEIWEHINKRLGELGE